MCGRYSLLTEDEIIEIREVIRQWSLRIVKDDFSGFNRPEGYGAAGGSGAAADGSSENRRAEVRPTDIAPVIIGHGKGDISLENLRWGFRRFDGKGVIINARSETLTAKGMFNSLLTVGRCLVPAGEYYEWEHKRKHFIKDREGNLLFMAGLYRDSPESPGNPAKREFVIITKAAYGDAEKIHDRMPVILKASQIEQWLGGELSPEEITRLNFNTEVRPVITDEAEQISLL